VFQIIRWLAWLVLGWTLVVVQPVFAAGDGQAQHPPRVLVLQTADPDNYVSLLRAGGAVNYQYALKHGYSYQSFVGLYRGQHAWHAAFNRIYLLQDILKEGLYDYVLYLDADAIVVDLSQKVEDLIEDGRLFYMASGGIEGKKPWHVNDGVFLFSCRHPMAQQVVDAWAEQVDPRNFSVRKWGKYDGADMAALQRVLQSFSLAEAEKMVKVYRGKEANFMNYENGKFIKQLFRYPSEPNKKLKRRSFSDRVKTMEKLAAQVMAAQRLD
jgi:hypothetical protein